MMLPKLLKILGDSRGAIPAGNINQDACVTVWSTEWSDYFYIRVYVLARLAWYLGKKGNRIQHRHCMACLMVE